MLKLPLGSAVRHVAISGAAIRVGVRSLRAEEIVQGNEAVTGILQSGNQLRRHGRCKVAAGMEEHYRPGSDVALDALDNARRGRGTFDI